MNADTPFQIWLMREPGSEGSVGLRFQVDSGQGVLGLRAPGRVDPLPARSGEERTVPASALQASRFIHLTESGQRRNNYAFSRISPEMVRDLPPNSWAELEVVAEYGFRYLVLHGKAAVAVATATVSVVPATVSVVPASVRVGRSPEPEPTRPKPAPRAAPAAPNWMEESPPPSPVPAERRGPPRPMPMDPTLGAAALRALSADKAVALLKNEMAKTAELFQRIEDLEARLRAAEERERDLLEVLSRWSSREQRRESGQ